MNRIAQSRASLKTDLELTTTPVLDHIPELLSAPAYIIQPGTPWVTGDGQPYGHYTVAWKVTAVVDVASNEVATHDLDQLIADALGVVDVEEISEPYVYASNTALHLAADITVTTTI